MTVEWDTFSGKISGIVISEDGLERGLPQYPFSHAHLPQSPAHSAQQNFIKHLISYYN